MPTILQSDKASTAILGNSYSFGLEAPAYLNEYTYAACYSIRQLRQAYGGPVMKVRNNTNNAEADVAFKGFALRTTSVVTITVAGTSGYSIGQTMTLATFAGSDDVRVVTWYDQSGNGRNMTAPAAGQQPALMVAGVFNTDSGIPSVVLDAVDDTLYTANFTRAAPSSVIAAMTTPNNGANAFGWLSGAATNMMSILCYPAVAPYIYAGTQLTVSGIWWALRRVYAAKYNGASSAFYVSSELNTSGNAGSTSSTVGFGINGDGARYQEILLIDGASTDLAALSKRLMAYFGF
jgi:hypothetical protein